MIIVLADYSVKTTADYSVGVDAPACVYTWRMHMNTSADHITGFVYAPASAHTWCMRMNTTADYIVGAYRVVHAREHKC